MSCDRYIYMLLIALLFTLVDWGIFFRHKEKQFHRKIRKLRKKCCANDYEINQKNVQKQRWSNKEKTYRVWKNICRILWGLVALLLLCKIIEAPVKSAVMQNKLDAMLAEMGGEMGTFNPLEALDADREPKDVAEELFRAMPCWELYHADFESREKKQQAYVKALSEEFDNQESSALEEHGGMEPENEKVREKYKKNKELLDAMELDRVPEGHSLKDVQEGKIPPLPITADTAMREADMRWENYYIKPDVSMLQQASKASADAAIGFSKDVGVIEMVVKYAGCAVNGYLSLMRYECAGESKADCCFWIAKIFRILSETMPGEWEESVEHCEMLSYAFCEMGVRYLDELDEKNDHADELRLLREEMGVRTR